MRFPNYSWLFLLCPLFAACDLISPYEQPTAPTAQAWSEHATDTAQPAWPEHDWWTHFQSPELTALIEEAQTHNNDLGGAIARVHEADAQVTVNGAPLLPSLDLQAGATRTIAPNGSTAVRRSSNAFNAGLSAAYEVDFWGKNRSALTSAEALRDASMYDRETVALTVTSSVATVYFDLLATSERLAIAKENLANAQQLLDALNRRFAQGLISKLDVAQQESIVAQQSASIPLLELTWSKDRDALAILLGRLPESMTLPEEKFAAIASPTVPEGIPSELLQRRPDVQFAEANLIAAHADINAARAAFFPAISLTATGGYQSSALSSLFNPGGLLVTLGSDLVQPIFENGLLSGALDFSKAREEELTQAYHKAIVSAFSDVEDALAAVHRNAEEVAAQTQAEQSAQEAFALSQQQFKGGTVDITSVLNTQRTLFSAADANLQAKLAYLQSIAGLYKALGGGWQKSHPL